jgi:hypothetical protein
VAIEIASSATKLTTNATPMVSRRRLGPSSRSLPGLASGVPSGVPPRVPSGVSPRVPSGAVDDVES